MELPYSFVKELTFLSQYLESLSCFDCLWNSDLSLTHVCTESPGLYYPEIYIFLSEGRFQSEKQKSAATSVKVYDGHFFFFFSNLQLFHARFVNTETFIFKATHGQLSCASDY